MFRAEAEDKPKAAQGRPRLLKPGDAVRSTLAKHKGMLKVHCIYCSTEILTTYKAHKQLMARMMGQTGSSSQSKVKYICKSCHSAGLKVPVTQEEKDKVAKWKAMAQAKKAKEKAIVKRAEAA